MSTPVKPSPHFNRTKMIQASSSLKPKILDLSSPSENLNRSRTPLKRHTHALNSSFGKKCGYSTPEKSADVHTPKKRGYPPNWERITWAPKKPFHHRQPALVA